MYVGSHDNSLYVFEQAATATPTATPTATTPTPTATPTPPIEVLRGDVRAGENCSLIIELEDDISEAFDFYCLAGGPCGTYTIFMDGKLIEGIAPVYTNVPGYPAPAVKSVSPDYLIPEGMRGQTITFYTVVVEAGKTPPVSSLSDLTPQTPYVIMMDRKTVTVAP